MTQRYAEVRGGTQGYADAEVCRGTQSYAQVLRGNYAEVHRGTPRYAEAAEVRRGNHAEVRGGARRYAEVHAELRTGTKHPYQTSLSKIPIATPFNKFHSP